VAYSNSFHANLVFDNAPAILQDPRIRAVTAQNIGSILHEGYWHFNPASGLYRPLTTLSYLLNYAVFDNGANPLGYHWLNFLLHGLNVTLVYALGILIFAESALALALAAVWGLHPLLTESVTNIVGRADELAAFGILAGLLCYTRWASANGRRKWWWLAATVAAQTIGLFSKENAAVLPGILLLYDLTWSQWRSWRARAPAYAALTLPFAVFFYLQSRLLISAVGTLSERNPQVGAGFWTARLTSIKVIGEYFWLFIWPARLSADYSYNAIPLFGWKLSNWEDIKALIALALCLGVLGLAIYCWRTWKAMFFFVGFFFVTLLPTSNLIKIVTSVMAERFLYLPLLGLAGCLVAVLQAIVQKLSLSWPASVRAARAAFVLTCLALAARTYARNFDWHDELSLWTSAVNAYPQSARSHMDLGNALADIPGRLPDAIAEFREALRILPDDVREHYNLGRALSLMPGRTEEAIAEFHAALRLQPDAAEVHYNLGTVLSQMPDRLPDAIAEFQAALRSQPDLAVAHSNLGNALARMPGRSADAVAEYQAALRIQPDLARAHYNLGNVFAQNPDRLPDAVAEYQAALHSEPRLAEAHTNLANALARMPGRLPDAIQEWRAALRLQPNLAQAHLNLGTALAQIGGQLPNAIAELEAAQRIHPNPQVQQLLDRLRKEQQ
jgi:tetratricopeptide (TPR) repeat protein